MRAGYIGRWLPWPPVAMRAGCLVRCFPRGRIAMLAHLPMRAGALVTTALAAMRNGCHGRWLPCMLVTMPLFSVACLLPCALVAMALDDMRAG